MINKSLDTFVNKYLNRNKKSEHCCDVLRFVVSCYNQQSMSINNNNNNKVKKGDDNHNNNHNHNNKDNINKNEGLPIFGKKDKFLFHLLFRFFGQKWENNVRTYIYEALLYEILYCRPSEKQKKLNLPTYPSCNIIDRVLQHGSTRQPQVTANYMILILEIVRYYKMLLPKGNLLRTLPFESVVHFFKSSTQRSHEIMRRKDFAEKFQNLVGPFKKEFDILYKINAANSNQIIKPKRVKLEFQDNIKQSISIPSTPSPQKSLSSKSSSSKPPPSSLNHANTDILFKSPNHQNDIDLIQQHITRLLKEEPFKKLSFSTKLNDIRQPLMDYYTIKLIEMQHIKNDKQKRNLLNRQNDALKSIEKSINQLLKCYCDHLDVLSGDRRNFIQKFGKGLVDIFGMDYNYCFLTPDKMSSIWQIILDWCSKPKPKSYNNKNNRYHDPKFEFDFYEDRIWLLKEMCHYKCDVTYIILLYDSKKPQSKGFIKQLGVCQRVRRSSQNNIISRRLQSMHTWNKNQVEGVKVNAHPHALLYGRRPFESIICDLCERDWNGSSWHCKNQCDFDTCHSCFVKYLERKQLYRAILYLREKAGDASWNINTKRTFSKKSKMTMRSEMFYDDIQNLQKKSTVLLSAIHQYLFYSYSCYIHPRIMDLLQIVLEVINPYQVQSLCKDIQLALFQLFDTDDVLNQLPKYIEVSLRFPQYLQLAFWTLLNAFLRTRNNSDELYIKSLKYLAKLKKSYIMNNSNVDIWITSTAMNGFLDWTQIVHRSKKIEEIYDALLTFPTKANYSDISNDNKSNDDDDDDDDITMNNNNNNNNNQKSEYLRSMSPSTTVFNASGSSFDEFHIQALVQLLSLKSPRWKTWLENKLKFLKSKYKQKQAEKEENDEYQSLNKARKRSRGNNNNSEEIFQCNISIDKYDEGYLLNLLKFYEYLTFVEPNIQDNAVSVMAKTFLFDADQRNYLFNFFNQFSALQNFLEELKDFWPPESSKSSSPKKIKDLIIPSQTKSTQDYIAGLVNQQEINSAKISKQNNNHQKRKKKRKNRPFLNDDDDDSDSPYDERVDAHDKETSDSDDDDVGRKFVPSPKSKVSKTRSKIVPKKQRNKSNLAIPENTKKRMFIETSNQSDSSSTSSSHGKKKNKNTRKYRSNKHNKDNLSGPAPLIFRSSAPERSDSSINNSPKLKSQQSNNNLIPKRRPLQFTPSVTSNQNNNKRSRMQSNFNLDGNNNNNNKQQPPQKRRKVNLQMTQPPIKRATSTNSVPKHYQNNNNNNNNNNDFKRSPIRKRKKRQIDDDSSDDEENPNLLFSKQKQRQKQQQQQQQHQMPQKSPTRSESSVSYEYEDDDDDEDESLATRYTTSSRKRNINNDNGPSESWFT